MTSPPLITILTDNPTSWMVPFVSRITAALKALGFESRHVLSHAQIQAGDILFLLSCERKLPDTICEKNALNIVIHESDLPVGRGWSPITWQVLQGSSKIVVCAIGVSTVIDGGPIYSRRTITLEGHELIDEIRLKQAMATEELCIEIAQRYPSLTCEPQKGTPTYFPRRTRADSQLDISKPLRDQFSLMRVADNDRYPLWFTFEGHRYCLSIRKCDSLDN